MIGWGSAEAYKRKLRNEYEYGDRSMITIDDVVTELESNLYKNNLPDAVSRLQAKVDLETHDFNDGTQLPPIFSVDDIEQLDEELKTYFGNSYKRVKIPKLSNYFTRPVDAKNKNDVQLIEKMAGKYIDDKYKAVSSIISNIETLIDNTKVGGCEGGDSFLEDRIGRI